MKTLLLTRFGQPVPIITKCGDCYDSVLSIINDVNQSTQKFWYWNTDHSDTCQGGILPEGSFGWYCLKSPKLGKILSLVTLAIWARVLDYKQLTIKDRIMSSLVPNPHQGGAQIMQYIEMHKGGLISDLSLGCLTCHPDDWQRFIDLFEIGERGTILLDREPGAIAPAMYRGL